MRKGLTTLLVILLALGAMLVSCKAEIEAPADELVAVSFDERTSRALSATLEEFNVNNYFWYYAAKKTDSTGLISGQTTTYDAAGAVAISTGDEAKGLSYFVPGFSQGTWKFTLYAYSARPTTAEDKAAWVYSGEATGVVLKKNETNMVSVTVNPNSQGDGFLFVDKEHIYLSEASDLSDNHVSPVITIEPITGEIPVIIPETNVKYTAKAGTYLVTVAYTDGYITYATGDVIATVYPGLTTTVTGYVDELVTYAQFDAAPNPDIVKETWGTAIIDKDTPSTGNLILSRALGSKTTKVESATMPAAAAVAKKDELAANVGADAGSSSLKLNLSVDTSEVTETAVTYDIGMEAVLTYEKNGQEAVATSDVKNINDYVIVVIDLESDITNVSVKHSDVAMIKFPDSEAGYSAFLAATVADDAYINPDDPSEGYKGFYCLRTDDDAKTLYIKTRSFSPFEVTYTMSDYVAVMDGVKYSSLDDAIAVVPTDGTLKTITLLKSIDEVSGITIEERNVILDLAGKTISMAGTTNIIIDSSTVSITGNGRIEVDPVRNKSAIEVGNNSTLNYLNGTLVVTNSTCPAGKEPAAYGIFLYNRETVNLGSKDSEGPTIDCAGPCLATNGGCKGGTFNVYSGTYTSARNGGDGDSNVIQIANTEDVELTNVLNIYGGSFYQTGDPDDGMSNIIELRYGGKKIINIEGGNFSCNGALINDWAEGWDAGKAYNYVITGAVAYMDGRVYGSLQDAIDAAPVKEETEILILRDVTDGSGLITEGTANAKYLTIDFGGHTYTVTGPAVGSTGTATQAMHWGDGSRITLKNGSFVVAEGAENVKMAMQNYSNLTIKGMDIDVSKVPFGVYPDTEKYGEYRNMPIPSFNTNRGSLTLRNTTVKVNSENGNYGCYVGGTSILVLYGTSEISGGVVMDEEGAMVVAWDGTQISEGVNKYFPEDEDHYISHYYDQLDEGEMWVFVKDGDGPSGTAWPMYMPDDDFEEF